MAIQNEPTRIQIPFADSGTKNVIPDTNSTPSASQAASWTDGFPAQCSLPLSAGGIPPARADFNGIFNTLSQSARFTQEGGVWTWDATVDYGTNRMVLGSDGLLYWSVAQSGPNVGGAQDPTTDVSHIYWVSPRVPEMPSDDSSDSSASTKWVNNWYANLILPNVFYVDPVNGDDSNAGTTATTAKRTIKAIEDYVASPLKLKPSIVYVNLLPGTYTQNIRGVDGVSMSYTCQSGVVLPGMNVYGALRDVTVIGTMSLTGMIQVYNALLTLGHANGPLSMTFNGVNADSCFRAQGGAIISANWNLGSFSINLSNCTVSSGVVHTEPLSSVSFVFKNGGRPSWSGSVTGKKYLVNGLSIYSGSGPAANIPGSTGTVDSLGLYSA